MKSMSAVKLGAALCASVMMIPAAFSQGAGGSPSQNPNDPYSSQRPGSPNDPMEQARERELMQPQEHTPVVDLASMKRMLNTSTYDDRKRVLSMLDDSISASRDEQKDLKRDAKKLTGPARDQFDAAAEVADSRREALHESFKALKKAKAEEWDSRKQQVVTGIDQYSAALDRARVIARNPGQPAQARPQ